MTCDIIQSTVTEPPQYVHAVISNHQAHVLSAVCSVASLCTVSRLLSHACTRISAYLSIFCCFLLLLCKSPWGCRYIVTVCTASCLLTITRLQTAEERKTDQTLHITKCVLTVLSYNGPATIRHIIIHSNLLITTLQSRKQPTMQHSRCQSSRRVLAR